LEALKAATRDRIAAGQGQLELGLDAAARSGPLEIVSSRMGHLWDGLCAAYDVLGFDEAADDEVFRQLVLARIIEPASKQDCLRVLAETGIDAPSYATLKAPAADLCRGCVPAETRRGVRRAHWAGRGIAGALRRVHALL
jgi:hypothetical protein